MNENHNYIWEYYQMIEDGSVTVGKWIHLLYKRINDDLENKVYFFDQKKANKAIKFFENFVHHSKGRLAPGHVTLEVWQKALLSCIFGLVDEQGRRQYRECFCVVARKCGKSLLASGIAEYMAYADGEHGADTYFLAPKLDQADIVFSDFWQSVSQETDLMRITKKRKMDIYIESTNTSIKKIPFSERKSDGFNPHLAVCDEIAAWVGEQGIKQYEVMTSALGSREQPLILSITTANYVNDGIYDELMKRATSFLQGTGRETRFLPFLYKIDDPSRWNKLDELAKSIPNLGVSVSVDYILEEIAKAEESFANRMEFMCKFGCEKQNGSAAWLNAQDIKKSFSGKTYRIEDFTDCYAVAGVDLSISTDLTAANLLIEKDGKIYYFTRFFLPASKIEEATVRDQIPYRAYIQRGFLIPSGDNQIDYNDVYRWFVDLIEKYKIYVLEVGYDRYNALYWVQQMQAYGFHMDSVTQGPNLTGVIIDTEAAIKDGRLICAEDNDLMKLHWMDTAVKLEDDTNRRKIVKIKRNGHIDGVASMLDAMCMRHVHWDEIGEQLENRGD